MFKKLTRTMMTTSTKRNEKQSLRRLIKTKVAGISEDSKVKQSEWITKQILQLDEFQKSKYLGIYLHMQDEVQTEVLLQEALKAKKKCFIPRYYTPGNGMDMVLLNDMNDYHNLPLTKWKIKQPAIDEVRPEALDLGLDLILVPGMAFTTQGHRLGRGKGYYDTYLSKAFELGLNPTTVALAFTEQILEEIPTDEHDVLINKVIFKA